MANEANESTKWLYEQLKGKGYNVGKDVNEFDSLMRSNADSRQWAYDTAKKSGLNVGKDIDEFSSLVGGTTSPAPVIDTTPDQTTEVQPSTDKKQEGWKPTPMQKAFMMGEIQSSVDSTLERMQQSTDNTRRLIETQTEKGRNKRKAAEMMAMMSGTPTKVLGLTPNTTPVTDGITGKTQKSYVNPNSPIVHGVKFEDGEVKTEWMLPDGSLTTSLIDADRAEYGARQARLQYEFVKRMEQNGLDPAKQADVEKQRQKDLLDTAEKQTSARLAENEENLHELYGRRGEKLDEQGEWNDDESFWSNFVRIVGGATNRSVTANAPKPQTSMTSEDRAIGTYLTENQVLRDAKKLLETRKLNKSYGFMGGFWKLGNNWHNMMMGARHALTDADLYAGGAMALQKASQLMDIEDKIKQGEDLTDAEVSLVYSTMLGQDVRNNIKTPHGYNAAQITVEMFPFMAQMALNPASGLSRAMVTKFGKSGLRKIAMRKAAQGLTGEAAEAFAKKEMRKLATKTAGVQLLGDMAEATVLANTLQAPKTAANAIERYQGDIVEDNNGNLSFDGNHNLVEAIYKAEASAIIENYTEMLGEHFGIIGNAIGKGVEKGLKSIGGGKVVDAVSDMVGKIGSTEWAKAIGEVEKRAHWNGTVGEVLEEEAGIVLNSIFTGDNKISDLWDADQQIDIVLGVGLFGGFVSGIKSVGYPIAKSRAKGNLRKRNSIGSWRFGDEWEGIRAEIEYADEKDLGIVIRDLVRSHAKSDEQGKAIVEYAHALMNARGYEIASASVRSEGNITSEQQDIEDSFEHGEQLADGEDPQAMNDAKKMLDLQRQRLASALSEDLVQDFDNDPIGALSNTHDPELRRIASDYVNAKMVYDGMIQRVRDDVDGRIAQSDAMIDSRVNRETGMVQPATMKIDDRKVYIVNGTVSMYEDGTGVDAQNSSESIIIRDAETGKVEFADPTQFLGIDEAIDVETEKEAARKQIIDEIAVTAANNIDGVLSFTPGDSYSILDAEGNQQPITILGNSVDEEGLPVDWSVDIQYPDGTIQSVVTSELQQLVDAASTQRVEQFDNERQGQRAAEDEATQHMAEAIGTENSGIVSSSAENVVTSQYGNGSEQNNDERTVARQADGSRVAADPAGSVEADRDRSDIRVYEEGLAASRDEHSEYGERARRNAEAERLIGIARQQGQYVERSEYDKLGEKHPKRTGESEVYIDKASGRVYKIKDPTAKSPMKGNVQPEDAIYEHLVHNKYFPETSYQFEGISDNNGDLRIILSQGYINAVDNATDGEIEAALAEKGLMPEGNYSYGNDEISVTDVTGDNALLGSDGKVYFIDPIIDFKKPVHEIIGNGKDDGDVTETVTHFSALSQIPTDEKGAPIYEQADPGMAWDALLEETEDEQIAQNVIAQEIAEREDALKKLEKQKPKAGLSTREKIQAEKDKKKAMDGIQQSIDHWKRMAGIKQRRQAEEDAIRNAEIRKRVEEARIKAEQERAEREEAERIEREALNGVPDWSRDTPQDARARGYRRNGPQKVDRQENVTAVQGKEIEVKFGENELPKGHAALIDATVLQPSHIQGSRNPVHFLDEAQPKERDDAASVLSAQKIASNIRPEEITSSVTAYTGAPTVNLRGETIQGNSRSDALRLMYESNPEQAAKYKQYLIDHATDYGLTPEQIASVEHPVLVNMLDVTDDEATFAQLVDANGVEVLKWMNQQGFITNTQYASAFDSKGNLSAEAANDLKGIMYQSIFTGGSTRLEEMFNKMPAKAQRAILATAFRDYDSAFADRMISEIQQSIIAFDALMGFEQFRDASNAEATQNAVEAWKKQYAFDDVSGEPYLPSETFSNFALALAAMYKGHTQRHIQSVFNMMYDIVQGTEQDNLFEAADKTSKPLAEAIRRVLNLEYQPVTKPIPDNGTNGSAVLDVNSEDGQDGRPGSDGNADGAEQSQEEAEPSDGGTGTASDSGQGGEVATEYTTKAPVAFDYYTDGLGVVKSTEFFLMAVAGAFPRAMSAIEAIANKYRSAIIENANPAEFVESKIGATIHKEIRAAVQEAYNGNNKAPNMVSYMFNNPTGIFQSEAHAFQIRLDQLENSVEQHDFDDLDTSELEKRVDVSDDGWTEGDEKTPTYKRTIIIDGKHEVIQVDEPNSDGFYTGSRFEYQGEQFGSLTEVIEHIDKQAKLAADIAAAEAEVNTDPTPAQKEAGNYKKGHVQVGTFDVTIEQPVGSVRRGTDADGKEWETTMQNTYGYIRGTQSVDGDHIDVFLSTEIDAWNGRRVVIVDQYNPDGTFDEHKVMLGFNDKADAINAYLANYEEGWEKGRRLVFSTATLEDFEKWIESSHRKQKPYHEYKIADKAEIEESTPENPVSTTGSYTIDTYTTKKNKTYHRVVFPRADKAVWQERLNLAKKMGGTSVPKGYGFKTREEAEAFAKAVADPAAVEDAQPLSLDNMRPTTGMAQVDVIGLLTQLSETGEANLADHSTPVEPATPEQAKADKPVNPSGNKLVTDERYAELRERMRKKLGGQLNMGVDPEILAIGTEMAVYHIEKGARKFKAYASSMIADLGDAIRPYLKSFYNAVRDMPEAEAAGLVADMDSYDEVRSVDIANFDKPGTDAMATAATVVAEQEAENEKAEAERKLQAYRHLVNKYAQDIAKSPMFKKAVQLMDSKAVQEIGSDLYKYYVGEDIETIAQNELYKMFVDQWDIDNGVLQSAIIAEAIRKAHKVIRDEQTTVNPDGTTTQNVVEDGTEIEITSGDFIPGVRPTVDEQKPGGKKKPGKSKPKPTTAPAITVPEQRPAADLIGDSAAFQERETQTVELVEEIGGVIESRVAMLQLDAESVKPLTMTDVKKMASKYPALKDISDTDLQELVELAMTQLTRSEALVNIDGTAEAQRRAFDHIVDLYQIQPSLNARDSERLIKQQYSTPTPFGFVMGQFVRAGGKAVDSMLEPSAGNGALTITVHPSVVHVNDIDDARLANLRKLGYGQVTAQDALLPFSGDKVDVVMTNPPFGTVTEKVYDGIFRISSLEGQMAINALEQMKDDGRAAIVIGGNTSYRTNGSMNPKDAAFFGYLYSHYNVTDVINISGKALYSRNGTGYDVRMILIDGRKTGEFLRVYPPVKSKARAEQVTTFDELYNRVQDDIQQVFQMGSQSANVQRDPETATDGTASAPVRTGSNRPNTGAGQRPGTTGDTVRDTPRIDSGQPTPGNDGIRSGGVDNAVTGNAGSTDNVPQSKPQQPRSVGGGSTRDGTGRSGSDGRGAVASRPDRRAERLEVKPDLTTEKVPYPNQSENGFTLMSVVPAAQAQVLQKSLGEIGDVDQYLVDELGYSSKEELYGYLAAEQVDSVALAIHQMNKGNAFIIGDMTGVGKGRQGAALIRYAVKQGKVPIYFTQKPTLFTDNYRDLADIGSSDLRPFIIASNPKDANIVDTDGNIVHKLPSKKEQERVFNYIMEHGTLPEEYDYVLTTYDQIKNGTADYAQNEDGIWNVEARKLPKKSKGYTTADHNGQARRDALAQLAEGNIAILDESHTVGGDSGCGRYMQMLTSSAEGVTFLSATFAKRADNMPIYAQRTAIAEAGVKASELIEAISKGGVTLQEIMSKQLVESGQMIRRERSFEGVTIDWLSVEEETNRRQRQQFNEVADIFNAIRNFQDDYITPLIDAKNEAAAEFGATVGHTQGTKDLGVKNVPFASKMYNLVNQLLFALKVDAVADRVIENLRNGYKPVISFTNTMEGFLSSAPKGVAMDDVPNFSLTLMRALDGVMRFTEKDAEENTEGGSLYLSDLSTEGQNAYNAIREKIINLSADLPISPMDAIRMKIEEAGYSVAEITGRTMQLNRTEDGRYIVEARKDRDKKAAMRDFNSGKLDVLMINKSGSTGISLHASSKFEDQRPRVMVFAQFQSDINDEVQMRGRIDRSGQVTRGRYEYIMSTIPAEQRIQMMFKAKLKSLDANTTSSQKSKFNEMEIVDYLNKYGDDVVWEYMKEHPELEERLGDPLDMLQEKKAEDGPRTSEKEDTSKKTGCAGKISRYLAFLSVEEQDEIFREITEAYRVKIQLLDDAGENDLEITTMPLRAETKQKKIWHEGENPGSGNAFADNTYVEEVEVDVLKKPMKRDEIMEATRRLAGEFYLERDSIMDWEHYAYNKGEEIHQFYQSKADEAFMKLREAGEARIAKAREKAVTAATKARGRGENNFTDEQIQSLADTVANEEREKEEMKQSKRHNEIMGVNNSIQALLQRLRAGGIYVVPQDLKQGTAEMFTQTFGTFVGFKFNKGYTLGSSTAIFATLDGRRKVELALSDPAINTIISATDIANRYSPDEIRAISMENWDSKVPTQSRQKRYIITGNLLQALVDTEKGEKTRGNLISFSTIDGETRQGILMSENFKLTDLRNSVSLSSRLAQIREGKAVVSENGDVQISKELYDWRHRDQYGLRVPKSKIRGGIYTMHPDLLKLVDGHNFITKGNKMVAYVEEANIAKVVDLLSREPFNLTVIQESQLSDVSSEEAEGDVLYRANDMNDIISAKDMAKLSDADRKVVEDYLAKYPSAPIVVVRDGSDVDLLADHGKDIRDCLKDALNDLHNAGVYSRDTKKIYIFADKRAIAPLHETLVHENMHAVVDSLGDGCRPFLSAFASNVAASPYNNGVFGSIYNAVKEDYHGDNVNDEFLAYVVQYGVRYPKVLEAVKKALDDSTLEYFNNVILKKLYETEGQSITRSGERAAGERADGSLSGLAQEDNGAHGGNSGRRHGDAGDPTEGIERHEGSPEHGRQVDGSLSRQAGDADSRFENDPWSKAWGESIRTKRQQKQFAERERERMRERAKSLSSILGLDIEVIEDSSTLKGKKQRAKGWYDTKTGKIAVVVSNHNSASDMEATILHEAVAHHGLRQLLGKHFDEFLDKVYEAAENGIKEQIDLLASRNGWNRRVATEEYLAGLAERTDFDRAEERVGGWFDKIKRLFFDMLFKAGFKHISPGSIGDNELRYILWRSYQNLANPGRYRAFEWEAEDVAMQYKLQVGEYDATSNNAITAADSDIRFRDGDFTPRDRALAALQYEHMLSRGSWQFREATQDSMLGLKTLYESILGSNLHIENVAGYENAYLYENRMSSANNGEQHQYFSRFMKPLLESIHKLCGSKEIDRRILTDYMMAKHGLERNEYMRNEAAANGEDTKRDFAGLCGLTGEDDWQVAETVAQQMVDDYEADHNTAELWANIKKATNATLEKLYLSGLISDDTYIKVLGMYDYYIPLRGWDETTSDEVYGYLTSKDGPLMGSVFKTAEGRDSKADDPIATIAMMADDAIRQGNRNIMKQRFLNFVHGNPSDLVSVNEMWLQHNDVTDEWEPVFADLQPNMTHAEVESEIAKFEAKMEALRTAEPDKYKKGRDARNIPYKVVRGNLNEHQVLVKRNGRTYIMTINGNPRAAQALNGLTNPNVEMGGVIGNMLKLGEYVNRHLSAFYTTRNPDFVVSNFMRDMLYSNCMTWLKENPRYALRFHKNFGKVNPLTLRRLLSKWENDNLSDSNYLEKMFKEFMLNGGETGYTSVKDIEGHKRTIASELKKQGSTGRKAWNALGMQLDLLNRSAENCARFAAFLTSREMGRTLDRSIYDAKEVSVNFNKKGSGGKFVNATGQKFLGKLGSYLGGGGRIAYVFWNAGIQGMTNFGRAGKRNPGKAIGGAAALFTLGYVIPLLAQMLGGGDGDDDDKNAYYNLPEYVRRSNICFKAGEQWITIPLPIEYRAIYGMGELASGVISGNERYSNSELTRHIASQVSQVMPLDMLEGGGGISPFIPSAFKPMTEAYILNKGWTGLPVYKDTPYNKNEPEWTKAYQSTDQHLVAFTRWLNETSGGNDYKKGTIDINPAKLEYLLSGTFGGAVSTTGKLKKMGETALGEREFEWRNMLLANRVIKSGDERTANRKLQNEYFKYLNEYEETNRLRKKYENAADDGILSYAERADFLYNSPEYLRFEIFEEYKPDIDAIREEIKGETDPEAKKELQDELFATMRELVDKLHNVDK